MPRCVGEELNIAKRFAAPIYCTIEDDQMSTKALTDQYSAFFSWNKRAAGVCADDPNIVFPTEWCGIQICPETGAESLAFSGKSLNDFMFPPHHCITFPVGFPRGYPFPAGSPSSDCESSETDEEM